MFPPMRAHWRHLANTIELMLPSTDRPTDHMHASRSVTVGRIYVRSTAMLPKNWLYQVKLIGRNSKREQCSLS